MCQRRAFTLVELLVVVAIIGVLVALLLPAVQSARESARKTQCANNLKQLAVASLNHETAHGHYPTGGWGFKWIGEPDAGYGEDQPGSWAYNILPYIEQSALRKIGAGVMSASARQEQLVKVVSTPLAVFHCPSKRPVQAYPLDPTPERAALAGNCACRAEDNCLVARGDYRANAGNMWAGDQAGPLPSDDPVKYWQAREAGGSQTQTGVSYRRSMVRVGQVTDGTSKTYLIGEKALSPANYFDGNYTADDQCVYSGHDNDNVGYTGKEIDDIYPPVRDWPARNADTKFRFGGAHEDGFFMARCDGSVQFTAFEIQELTFYRMGGRHDGED
jgi:prepilin-type N-terminal cleavage/methylation domain-containing protein